MRKPFRLSAITVLALNSFWVQAQVNFELNTAQIVYNDGCKNEYASCKGQIDWESGAHYRGDLKGGAPNGWGVYRCNNKSTYTGEFFKGLAHGKGQKNFTNGDSYSGEWKNGKMHGKGVYTWKNGHKINGFFEEGFLKGFGIFHLPNGEAFKGNWHNYVEILQNQSNDKTASIKSPGISPLKRGTIFLGKSKQPSAKKEIAFQVINQRPQVFIWSNKPMTLMPDQILFNNQIYTGDINTLHSDMEKNQKMAPGLITLWYSLGHFYKEQKNIALSKENLSFSRSFTKTGTKIHNILSNQIKEINDAAN